MNASSEYDDLIHRYLDGQCSEAEARALFEALASNAELQEEFQRAVRLHEMLQETAASYTAPPYLAESVMKRVGIDSNGNPKPLGLPPVLPPSGFSSRFVFLSLGFFFAGAICVWLLNSNSWMSESQQAGSKPVPNTEQQLHAEQQKLSASQTPMDAQPQSYTLQPRNLNNPDPNAANSNAEDRTTRLSSSTQQSKRDQHSSYSPGVQSNNTQATHSTSETMVSQRVAEAITAGSRKANSSSVSVKTERDRSASQFAQSNSTLKPSSAALLGNPTQTELRTQSPLTTRNHSTNSVQQSGTKRAASDKALIATQKPSGSSKHVPSLLSSSSLSSNTNAKSHNDESTTGSANNGSTFGSEMPLNTALKTENSVNASNASNDVTLPSAKSGTDKSRVSPNAQTESQASQKVAEQLLKATNTNAPQDSNDKTASLAANTGSSANSATAQHTSPISSGPTTAGLQPTMAASSGWLRSVAPDRYSATLSALTGRTPNQSAASAPTISPDMQLRDWSVGFGWSLASWCDLGFVGGSEYLPLYLVSTAKGPREYELENSRLWLAAYTTLHFNIDGSFRERSDFQWMVTPHAGLSNAGTHLGLSVGAAYALSPTLQLRLAPEYRIQFLRDDLSSYRASRLGVELALIYSLF